MRRERLEKLKEFFQIKYALEKKDFAIFCKIVGQDYGIKDLPDFQLEWVKALQEHKRLVIFSPVEHGKSTIMSLLYPLWRLGLNPELRIVIISDTDRQAMKYLYAIKQKIMYCQKLKSFFPRLRPIESGGKIWSSRSIIVERESLSEREPSIQAIGCRGAILGARLDLVIADDVLNDKNTSTREWIEKIKRWWNSIVISRLTKESQVVFIGNAWDYTDLAHTLARSGSYHVINQQAIKDGKPIFPQVWSLERLAQRKRELQDEREYRRQFFNIPPTSDVFISKEIINSYLDEGIKIGECEKGMGCYVGVDLSGGGSRDCTCIFVIAKDGNKIRVVDIKAGKWSINEIIDKVMLVQTIYEPRAIFIESNVGQSYVVQLLNERDIEAVPFHTSSNKNDRKIGVDSVIREISEGRWKIPSGESNDEINQWINEILRYDGRSHVGDRLMASWIARQAMRSDEMLESPDSSSDTTQLNYSISNKPNKLSFKTDLWE